MKARIPPQDDLSVRLQAETKEELISKIDEVWREKIREASNHNFIMGGYAAMKTAADYYADRIRNGTPEESHAAALELLDYLTEKSEGLKKVGEGAPNEPDSTGVEPSNQ